MESDEESVSELQEVWSAERIARAPERQLRAVLKALCKVDVKLRERMTQALEAVQSYDGEGEESEEDEGEDNDGGDDEDTLDVDICYRCNKAWVRDYDLHGDCRYHPKPLVVDDSAYVWEGWIWEDDGLQDTPENRENMPEGFRYTCCDQTASARGCTYGKHRSLEDKASSERRRQRKRSASKISQE
ncbi:hypothetical protein QBC41DRAFT_27381 [Cercophora samala]|uniref:C2H2-type domain-containing protein n=1 Tax=Cercophora samala TaxID=330535 RepID=A0AA39Z2L0_9PEZI|nr:hypothetical protein QBC41DRAFT_27381 [Cercophora samala]